ncbi:hypothetical protein [Thalassovita aquimarina]|uniref:Uncharacterized protein n=1 Tax=Thalassovita aquimarina TaxID=2785917 RepID=A0ABS5HMB1_9RHOB|nr:hypothetical protein [Thalassovita aquimarina]MBR9650076.1 hypothetical protein [Thalassovita aquimarina]
MTGNIAIGPDAQINHALSVLRNGTAEGGIGNETRLLPGVVLRADPELKAGGRYTSPEGRLLDLDVTTAGAGSWLALHLSLGGGEYAPGSFVGFACRVAAPEPITVQPCLRSGTEDGFVDRFYNKHILAMPEEASHLDALPLQNQPDLPLHAPWRELILFLPTHSFRWSLHDLRVFVI